MMLVVSKDESAQLVINVARELMKAAWDQNSADYMSSIMFRLLDK